MKSTFVLLAVVFTVMSAVPVFADDNGGQGGTGKNGHNEKASFGGEGSDGPKVSKDAGGQGGNGIEIEHAKDGAGQGGNG